MPAKVFVGTASWTDPGFIADWYPKKTPASERLAWYAGHFNMVEVNSSFYAVPQRRMVERWCRQTPQGFVFNVKLHKLLSRHSTDPQTLPPDLRKAAECREGKVKLTPDLEEQVTRRFLQEIEPFASASKLGVLLLQLSPSFGPGRHELPELDALIGQLRGHDIAIELRNRNWVSPGQQAGTEKFFRDRNLAFVCVDAPSDPHFSIMPAIDLVTHPRMAYMRMHGRNARGYLKGRTVAERFNHQYSDPELAEIAERAAKLAEKAVALHIVFNNNASDYAPRAAIRFREIASRNHCGKIFALESKPGPPPREQNLELDFPD